MDNEDKPPDDSKKIPAVDDNKEVAIGLFLVSGVCVVIAAVLFAVTPSCSVGNGDESGNLTAFQSPPLNTRDYGYEAPVLNMFPEASSDSSSGDGSGSSSYDPAYGSYIQSSYFGLSNSAAGSSYGSSSSSYSNPIPPSSNNLGLSGSTSFYGPGSSSSLGGDPPSLSDYPPKKASQTGNRITSGISQGSVYSTDVMLMTEDFWGVSDFSCGVQQVQPSGPTARVVGGSVAVPHSWPWAVNLLKGSSNYFYPICGGTIISPRHVISALHCVDMAESNIEGTLRIAVGKHNNQNDTGTHEEVAKIRPHPFGMTSGKKVYYDLILITLKRELTFSDNVQPACLPPLDQAPEPGKMCWAYGWGNTQKPGGDGSLKQVEVEVGDETECYEKWKTSAVAKEYAVCAGKREGHDTCQGDSGGPLTCQEDNKWVLYGATSWGGNCGSGRGSQQMDIRFQAPEPAEYQLPAGKENKPKIPVGALEPHSCIPRDGTSAGVIAGMVGVAAIGALAVPIDKSKKRPK